MSTTYTSTSGPASSAVDVSELLALADRITDGAASGFVKAAQRTLKPVQEDATERFPVRTGDSRDSIAQRVKFDAEGVAVALGAWAGRAKFVKFSRYTTQDLAEEAERWAARGNSADAQARILAHAKRRLKARHGLGAPTEELAARSVTVELIRKPAKAREKQLATEAQAEILKLADVKP